MSATVKVLSFVFIAAVGVAVWIIGFSGDHAPQTGDVPPAGQVGPVTFCKDVAPLVFARCANCHRPGESAPFSLLTYEDVKTHADQIVDITKDRVMPPWLPEAGHGEFVGSRRLTDAQVNLFQRWVDDGELEGDRADLPPLPKWTEGWQLGEPDMVVTMPEEYTLRAEGTDVFRNFVIPIPVASTRYVRAVELRPGNKRVVHHANMFIDRTRSTRRLDEQDPGPGFDGMDPGDATYPDGHFLGWTPGSMPDAGVEGISWRLEPGSDLVLQLHLVPGGKPEPIRSSIGLFFDNAPRTSIRAYTILLQADEALDIPPGAENFVVGDTFTLPLDTRAILVYPHAHYLGKQIHAFAVLPNGQLRSLILINDWDFNWQDSYRYKEPVFLPKETVLSMRWVFDNSTNNVRNPSTPPKRVKSGNRSIDEMAHLYLQLLVRNESEANLLREAAFAHRVRKFPGDPASQTQLGRAQEALGKTKEAMASYQAALRFDEDYPVAHRSLGLLLESQGEYAEATEHYRHALRTNPDDVRANFNLAYGLQLQERVGEAIQQYRTTLNVDPQFTEAINNLAWLLATSADEKLRRPSEAIELAQRASELLKHRDPGTLDTLSAAYAADGQYELAKKTARAGLKLATDAGNRAVINEIQGHLRRYERGQPLWEADNTSDASDR